MESTSVNINEYGVTLANHQPVLKSFFDKQHYKFHYP